MLFNLPKVTQQLDSGAGSPTRQSGTKAPDMTASCVVF